jgi:hypothetical protein
MREKSERGAGYGMWEKITWSKYERAQELLYNGY